MKATHWIILFIITLIGELAGIQLNNTSIQFIFKPLLLIIIGGYFLSATKNTDHPFKKWIVSALIFSWAGDVLLLFQEQRSVFFLLGLSAFLIAHIFYIVFFHSVRVKESIKSNPWLLVLVVVYYAILITVLSPHLGNMKLPVRIYGIVISFMFMLAMHMLYLKNKVAGSLVFWGALLFVSSDSVLAINKFYLPFEPANSIIMLTYGLAQLFIIQGAIRYIRLSD